MGKKIKMKKEKIKSFNVRNLLRNERGEISLKILVTFILLLVSFGVILWSLYGFITGPIIDRETCHQSVIYRGTLPAFGGMKEFVPLKCKEAKYCVTGDLFGGDCEEFAGHDDVFNMRVSNKRDIEKFLAREVLDCWKTMGEGKVSLITDWMTQTYGFGGGDITSSCTICSRVAFDEDSLKDKGINYEEIDLFTYMLTHRPPGKDYNYFEEIGESGDISISEIGHEEVSEAFKELDEGDYDIDDIEDPDEEEIGQMAIMFMQIEAPNYGDVLENTMKTAAVGGTGSFLVAPIATVKAVAKSAAVIPAVVLGIGFQQTNVAIQRGISAGYCGDIAVGDDARTGCSVVRVTGYDADSIGDYCSIVESIS